MLATDYPLLNLFWTMIEIFFFVIWIWILITVLIDVFRSHDLSGWAKALWLVFIVFLPLLGVLIYLIAPRRLDARARGPSGPGAGRGDEGVRAVGRGARPEARARPTNWRSWRTSATRA